MKVKITKNTIELTDVGLKPCETCGGVLLHKEDCKPRTRFCWHCSRQLRGNHFAEYQSENGPVTVHKDCKRILEGGFNHVRSVDDKGGSDLVTL